MQYFKLTVNVSGLPDYEVDTITYYLSEAGFESFDTDEDKLNAYIQKTALDAEGLKTILSQPYSLEEVEDKDWNEEWEKNYFQPIVIDNKCVVHSTFHKDIPAAEFDILIDPKMAFGTGHHATTGNMLRWILEDDMTGCKVLDMGCGTAILGILAEMRGAASVLGIDVDDWCVRNSEENIALNKGSMKVELGNADSLKNKHFDVVLANINRNILLNDMHAYVDTLPEGGRLYMSGFYTQDIPFIAEEAQRLGMTQVAVKEKDNWVAVKFVK